MYADLGRYVAQAKSLPPGIVKQIYRNLNTVWRARPSTQTSNIGLTCRSGAGRFRDKLGEPYHELARFVNQVT